MIESARAAEQAIFFPDQLTVSDNRWNKILFDDTKKQKGLRESNKIGKSPKKFDQYAPTNRPLLATGEVADLWPFQSFRSIQ